MEPTITKMHLIDTTLNSIQIEEFKNKKNVKMDGIDDDINKIEKNQTTSELSLQYNKESDRDYIAILTLSAVFTTLKTVSYVNMASKVQIIESSNWSDEEFNSYQEKNISYLAMPLLNRASMILSLLIAEKEGVTCSPDFYQKFVVNHEKKTNSKKNSL